MSRPSGFVVALFRNVKDQKDIPVHFNPASLQYSVTNTMKEQGEGNTKKQYVSQSSGKLTMDLIFDTTHEGSDVRTYTDQIAKLMEPDQDKIPPVVQFEWGKYVFRGMMESYKETIDFFAPNGVPLRASVNLTLARQDKVFESATQSKFDTQQALKPEPVQAPGGIDPTGAAQLGGNPFAARAIASFNGLESMRFSAGPISVDASVTLSPPVGFATGGVSGEAGFGFSVSGGIGTGSGPSFGASASAGISASAGAFSGLRASVEATPVKLDTRRLLQRSESAGLATDQGATFNAGGRANVQGSGSLSADVGVNASLKAKLQFDGR